MGRVPGCIFLRMSRKKEKAVAAGRKLKQNKKPRSPNRFKVWRALGRPVLTGE